MLLQSCSVPQLALQPTVSVIRESQPFTALQIEFGEMLFVIDPERREVKA